MERAIEFGDYIIYVDESGDHSLSSIDASYPLFTLAFCIFNKADYVNVAVPAMQNFKLRWFGHDTFIMHESDIVKRRYPFAFLQYDGLRSRFMDDLTSTIAAMPMTVISSVIRKDRLRRKYTSPENPYQLGLLFCLEMALGFLRSKNADARLCHIVCESRSPREKAGRGKEDAALELEFRRILDGKHYLQRGRSGSMSCFDIVFASKLANSTGLQIADLIARPIGLSVLREQQANRAFEVIRPKIWGGWFAGNDPVGLKVFP